MSNPVGSSHVDGDYNYPNDGLQFINGCQAILSRGFPVLKIYATGQYVANYPLQVAWSSVPTNLTQLMQTTQYASQIALFSKVVFTAFTFANGITNWWRADVSVSKMQAEYTEMYNLAVHLLTTYNGQGKEFVFQNWEGDWAFQDTDLSADVHVNEWVVHNYVAYLGTRQRAIRDARAAVASDCQVIMAFEANRVLDARLFPHRRRILRDIACRIQPDVISYSAYDATIVQQGVWGSSQANWLANTTPVFTKALRELQLAFPGVPIQLGEFGYPETEAPVGYNCGGMCVSTWNIWVAAVPAALRRNFLFWEVFDNTGGRGYYIVKSDGTTSDSGVGMMSLINA